MVRGDRAVSRESGEPRPDQVPLHGPLDDLWDAVRLLGLPRGRLRADCVYALQAELREPDEPESYMRVATAHAGPWAIVVDEAAGVFRWVSGPDVGGLVG